MIILYGNDHCGFSQSWLVAATHCLCLCAMTWRWRPSCPMNTSPIWKRRPGMLVHIGLSLFSYATLIIAALYALQLAWID
ncbi:hypothetical protein ACNKHT_17080 [Shigella flexneri]